MAGYKLRCFIVGHEKDVRAISPTIFPSDGILSGSRDVTARVWIPNEMDPGFHEGQLMRGHSNFVSAVCVMPPDSDYEQGLLVTGSNDHTILGYTPNSTEPVFKLTGHEGTVCTLAAGKFGTLISGSWDKTARVWLNKKCVMTLKGHQAAVWAVGIVPEQGYMLTGSADKTIKLWKAGKCENTFTGHEDCVRGLAVLNMNEFISCANDATIRRWSMSGDCLQICYGHENFVYSIAVLPNGQDFISGSEDRTVRVWRDGKCVQTIAHPAQSVWAVCVLPGNGDIVTGASDGVIRVFTTTPERMAPEDEQKSFEEQVAATAVPKQLGDVKLEDLPGPEVLLNPGTKEGQQKIIRRGPNAELHQWDMAKQQWTKVGDVVGSSGGTQQSSGKTLYEGKEYDYVFSVDIEDGKPPLKLPFNVTEDPWFAAQRFLEKNSLSQLFLDQVANFIIDNTKGVTLGQETSGYVDPFTGGSRHVPGSQSSISSAPASGTDPFTGGGRYIPGGQTSQPQISGSDPFTGAGSYRPQDVQVNLANNTYFPQKTYVTFETANHVQIINKLKEFNDKVGAENQLSSDDLDSLQTLMEAKDVTEAHVGVMNKVLRWPKEYIFPGLDVLRVSIRDQKVCEHVCSQGGFLDSLLRFLDSSSPVPTQMLTLRILVNCFLHESGRQFLLLNRDPIITQALNCRLTPNKNVQIAVSTLLLNYSVSLQDRDDEEGKSQCLLAVASVMENPMDPEAEFRLLVCLGTLISNDKDTKELAKSLEIQNLIIPMQTRLDPKKVSECAGFVINRLQ
ncbi:phospholipase A-2-activating protein-like [Saccostrea echinata]|uniref:phospholipase A-2-activating protein-like n=1 Tax=Saccostrea echinata TaxID=191078 RepID=UPI002A829B12|nr:phospholipase A-2-activating protein-like [Saccostrea echinata]